MDVPFLDLLREYNALTAEISAAIQTTLARGTYILGAEVSAFENEWAQACGAAACAGVGNGTDAPALALLACGVQPGDEVITAPLTAAYTALAIRQIGAVPVFGEIDEQTFTLAPAAVRAAITPKTRAILPVALYGQMPALSELQNIAAEHSLPMIVDCAQAHGATHAGQPAGAWGAAATFSFYPTKNLGAFGDGGAVVASDSALIERVKILRQGGHLAALQGRVVGMNSRLDELHAAMLRVKQRYLAQWTTRRQTLAARYDEALRAMPLQAPVVAAENSHVYHLYVVQCAAALRAPLRAHLAAHGVETLIHYPYLLHQQPLFARAAQPALPRTEQLAQRIFSLPLNPHLSDQEQSQIIAALRSFAWSAVACA